METVKKIRYVRRDELNMQKTIPFKFGPEHREYIRKCRSCTYNILEGAVRSGKTTDNVFAFAHELKTTPDRIHLATGSTLGNAKMNLGDSNGFGLEWIFRGQCRWGKYRGMEALVIQGPDTNFQQKIIIFAGAAKADSFKAIRGNSYGLWIATEVNLHHDSFIKEAFNRQLAAANRKIFWDLNPEHPGASIYKNYIDLYAEKAEEGTLLGGYNYRHFDIFQNATIPEERLKEIISQYDQNSIWYERDILGHRVVAEGLIYPMYLDAIGSKPKGEPEKYVLSIDYGTKNAFSAGLWGLYEGTWWRIKEYYYSGRDEKVLKTDEDYGDDIDAFTDKIGSVENRLRTIIDPSAASFIALLRRRKKYRVIPADNDVIDGIRETATALQTGSIKIDRGCENWIDEAQGYVWDDDPQEDRPVKVNDHAMDETRYFVKTMNIVKNQWKTAQREKEAQGED